MRMVRKTSFAVSLDVQRAILTGVCWKIYRDRHLMACHLMAAKGFPVRITTQGPTLGGSFSG